MEGQASRMAFAPGSEVPARAEVRSQIDVGRLLRMRFISPSWRRGRRADQEMPRYLTRASGEVIHLLRFSGCMTSPAAP